MDQSPHPLVTDAGSYFQIHFSNAPDGLLDIPGVAGMIDPDRSCYVQGGQLIGSCHGKWQFCAPWRRSWPNDQYSSIIIPAEGQDRDSAVCAWTRGWSLDGGTHWWRLMAIVHEGWLTVRRYNGEDLEMIVAQVPYKPKPKDVVTLKNYGGFSEVRVNDTVLIPEHYNETVPFGIFVGCGVFSDGPYSRISGWQGGAL